LETETLELLMHECANIMAMKEASGDIEQMKAVIARRRADFCVLSGDDTMALRLIEAGGHGVVSVASNLVPDRMVAMIHAALQGDFERARALEAELDPLFQVEFIETNPIPIKTALALQGMCAEVFRLPLCELEQEEHRSELVRVLRGMNIIT